MKTAIIRCIAVSILPAAALAANAEENIRTENDWSAKIGATFNRGRVDGFLQTPAGGQPGSSSYQRPTLDELNIDDVDFYDVLGTLQWHRLDLYAGYQSLALNGSATLSENLISRGVTFPAATRVHTDTALRWLRAGAGWRFEFLDDRLQLIPKAEYALLDFNYNLKGGVQSVERDYRKGTVRVGLESRYRFNRAISFSVNAATSLPIANTPRITAITGGFEIDLPGSAQLRPQLFLGGGAQRFDYEDNQELPNHFHVAISPFVAVGLGLAFE